MENARLKMIRKNCNVESCLCSYFDEGGPEQLPSSKVTR